MYDAFASMPPITAADAADAVAAAEEA